MGLVASVALLANVAQALSSEYGRIHTTRWAEFGHPLFGTAVAAVGDVDGDGTPDVLIANPGLYGDLGIVWVLSGCDGRVLHRVESSEPGDGFGADVRSCGDVDGDGRPDWIVGSPDEGATGASVTTPFDRRATILARPTNVVRWSRSYATVFSGRTGGRILDVDGEVPGDDFGASVSGAGDVDGDGLSDLLVGAPAGGTGELRAGCAYVFSGADGSLLRRWTGATDKERFGSDVCTLGDVDADGCADHAIAGVSSSMAGRSPGNARGDRPAVLVRVFSGKTGSLAWSVERRSRCGFYGVKVRGGDVDGDGLADVLIAHSCGFEAFSGASGAGLWRFEADWQAGYGGGIDALGDLDDNGSIELLVGQPRARNTRDTLHVFSIGERRALYSLASPLEMWEFGQSIAALGDLDGDGASDFVVGTENSQSHDPGQARIYSGRRGELWMELRRSGTDVKRTR